MTCKSIAALLILLSCTLFNISYADDSTVKFDCTLTDTLNSDDSAGEAKDTFDKNTPKVYLVCDSNDLQKNQVIKSTWVAADTNNVAPPNYTIDEKSLTVDPNLKSTDTYTANFSLSKPNAGWPVGSYHVDLYVDGKFVQSVKFSVK